MRILDQRKRLADFNADGRLDVAVGLAAEHTSDNYDPSLLFNLGRMLAWAGRVDMLLTLERVAFENGWEYCVGMGKLLKSTNETPFAVMMPIIFIRSATKRDS